MMQSPRILSRHVPLIITAVSVIFFWFALSIVGTPKTENPHQAANRPQYDSTRPKIYRFQAKGESAMEKRLASMWELVWEAAGWQPMSVGSDVTPNRSDYTELQEDLNKTQLSEFQKDQILKYVAMAAIGGGWLSQSDVLPLQIFTEHGSVLPNEGRLTVYDDMFPSLMSARSGEWLWMARLLVKHARTYKGMEPWSEKTALRALYSPDSMEVQREMHSVRKEGNHFRINNEDECLESMGQRAVHFQLGDGEIHHNMRNGENAATRWLAEWMNTCDEDQSSDTRDGQSMGEGRNPPGSPIMYQFVPDVEKATDESLRQIRFAWHAVWEEAGWKPMTLNVMDYALHDEYRDVRKDLEHSSLDDQQKWHIWKYVAMAAVGGGFVAHSDTFPLQPFVQQGQELPNNGRLTLYDDKFPCLISGSATEWLKVARILAKHARSYQEKERWTEAVSLREHWLNSDAVALQTEIWRVSTELAEPTWEWSSAECRRSNSKRAAHFAIDDFALPGVKDPAGQIVQWLGKWLDSCEPSKRFQPN